MAKEFDMFIQITTALGSLATFGAFLMLFRRDKDKQEQINKLTGIASFLEAQNETMKEHNNLIAQQVEIFRNTSILKGQDAKALMELKEIEEKKYKLSVKPILWLNGAGYSGYSGELRIDLNNKGEVAEIINLKLISEDIILHPFHYPYSLEKDQRVEILGKSRGNKHIKDCDYEINITYRDKLENVYESKIVGKGANVKIVKTLEVNS